MNYIIIIGENEYERIIVLDIVVKNMSTGLVKRIDERICQIKTTTSEYVKSNIGVV